MVVLISEMIPMDWARQGKVTREQGNCPFLLARAARAASSRNPLNTVVVPPGCQPASFKTRIVTSHLIYVAVQVLFT
jgi:hypothetical protein